MLVVVAMKRVDGWQDDGRLESTLRVQVKIAPTKTRVRMRVRILRLAGLESTALFIAFLSRLEMGCLRPGRTFEDSPLLHQGLAETVTVPAAPCMTPWSMSVGSCLSAWDGARQMELG